MNIGIELGLAKPATAMDDADNIRVYCRLRGPVAPKACAKATSDNTVAVEDRSFDFTWVGDETAAQDQVFEVVGAPLTQAFLNGFNACAFSYGQTGSGKTFTIHGPSDEDDPSHPQRGLLPRCIEHVFSSLQAAKSSTEAASGGSSATFVLRASYLEVSQPSQPESSGGSRPLRDAFAISAASSLPCPPLQIYNERVYDLLAGTAPSGSTSSAAAASSAGTGAGSGAADGSLSIRESASRGQYVEGLTEAPITSVAQAQALLRAGAKARRVAATAMNHESSRSHAVFTLAFESAERTTTPAGAGSGGGRFGGGERAAIRSRSAQFHLIDLAGSERQKSTGAAGDRLKEAGAINRSLSALAGVIAALVDVGKGKARHIPYRDSKLVSVQVQARHGGGSASCSCSPSRCDARQLSVHSSCSLSITSPLLSFVHPSTASLPCLPAPCPRPCPSFVPALPCRRRC